MPQRGFRFASDVISGWLGAGAFTLAAALAYYAVFSIAPLLLLSIHIASLFLDRSSAVESITGELIGIVGPTGSDAIKQMLEAAGTAQPEGWSGLVSIGVLLFAAAGFVGSLQDALDKIWDAPPAPSGMWQFLRTKLFSFSLVLAAAFMLLITLVLSTAMTVVTGRFTTAVGLPEGLASATVATANFALSALVFAAIFKFVPSASVNWRAAAAGGIFTALLFSVGRFALAWYLGREAEASAYGAATSLVLLLIWVYYSAQILFLGAQFSQTWQDGSRPIESKVVANPPSGPAQERYAQTLAALALGFFVGALISTPSQKPS